MKNLSHKSSAVPWMSPSLICFPVVLLGSPQLVLVCALYSLALYLFDSFGK